MKYTRETFSSTYVGTLNFQFLILYHALVNLKKIYMYLGILNSKVPYRIHRFQIARFYFSLKYHHEQYNILVGIKDWIFNLPF